MNGRLQTQRFAKSLIGSPPEGNNTFLSSGALPTTMTRIDPDTWNTWFGWMTGQECTRSEGCPVMWDGVVVYVFLVVFVAAMLYWNREELRERALQVYERLPNPFS